MNRFRAHPFRLLLIAALLPGAIGCSRRTAAQLVEDGSYTKAIRKDSTWVEAYWRHADIYARRRQYDKAITDLDRAIHFDSTFNAGYLFGDRGNIEETTGELEKAIDD